MFDKTTNLLKGHQRTANEMGEELREMREMCECQTDRFREVMEVVHSLGLTTVEGDRLRRIRSQQRLSRRMEAPADTYSSLSSHYRRRRQDLTLDSSHVTLEEEGDDREDGVENPLYDCVNTKHKRPS